ncbi:flagellar hook-length control protein FliK [Hyphomonas sp. WL0036]|uniref:flagellar hook-length control protein FliK n=1 Tax=Hyphomonas sediminis TaxID=2866160 RepID=UPI001C7E68ED|nr:flagellar hook-length control protein FliK [Hyphomonas sediminis]MBY9065749.1 flagellar hook-length control protein FliK [Hyphomonas sediminis]
MTFSVDLDLWSPQKGPVQDAETRARTGDGRGKDFASSLLGVPANSIPETSRSLFAGPADALTSLNAVNLHAPRADAAPETLLGPTDPSSFSGALAISTPPAADLAESDAEDAASKPSVPTDEADPERASIAAAAEDIKADPKALMDAESTQLPAGLPLPPLSAEVADATAFSEAALITDPSAQELVSEQSATAQDLLRAGGPGRAEGELEPDRDDLTATDDAMPVPVAAPTAAATVQPDAKATGITITPPETFVAMTAGVSKQAQAVDSELNNGQLVFEMSNVVDGDSPAVGTAPAEGGLNVTDGNSTARAQAPASNDNSATTSDEPLPRLPDARPAGEAAMAAAATTETTSSLATATTGSDAFASASSSSSPFLFGPTSGHSPITAQAALSQPVLQTVPTHAVMVATASELPGIVARSSTEAQDDRVVVQLDPPELGRVSIDFKFDAQGLQHVTITAETPEAMRQLRQMHFELTQALERNGLSGQSMSFQHQHPQQDNSWGQQTRMAGAKFDTPVLSGNGLVIAADSGPGRQAASGGRLDIKL